MCGIYGYIGLRHAYPAIKLGLEKLEYRGYNSCGVCLSDGDGGFFLKKVIGGATSLPDSIDSYSTIGIGHNRWATHGEVTIENAHPHVSHCGTVSLVHNGVIENSDSLKEFLSSQGHSFYSETDSEVLCNLVSYYLNNKLHKKVYGHKVSFEEAVKRALDNVEGTYGLVILSTEFPDRVICARRSSPLAIGSTDESGEYYISSDAQTFTPDVNKVAYLEDGQIVVLSRGGLITTDMRFSERTDFIEKHSDKGSFGSFLEKEIFEQPEAIANTINGRLTDTDVKFGGISLDFRVKRVLFLGCGTAYHAGLLGKYYIENIAGIPASVEIASEYKYKNNPTEEGTLVVAISQSGETIDTLEAVKEAQNRHLKTIAITNGVSSSIARQVDEGIYQRIGREVSVASTKAFTSQATIALMLSVLIGRQNSMTSVIASEYISSIKSLPSLIQKILEFRENIENKAQDFSSLSAVDFLGRQYLYPIALESSLKLKELAYIDSSAYPSGEIKHGPLAMVSGERGFVYFATQSDLLDKDISTMREIRARGGKIICVQHKGVPSVCYDSCVYVPEAEGYLMPIISVVVSQLFCVKLSKDRNDNIDKPRHLAKSVTVE